MAKKEAGHYFSIGLLVLGVLAVAYMLNVGMTGYVVSEAQSNFSEGSFVNTTFENGEIFLSPGNTSGTYTSEIFDANESVNWNNLTWVGVVPETKINQVSNEIGWINSTGYTLSGFGSSWTNLTLTALYNATDNSSIGLENVTFNSSTGVLTNSTESEWNDVLVSYEYSTTINTSISFQARVSDDSNFTNSSFESVEDVNNLSLEGQYFQYLVLFETSDSEISPSIEPVSVFYGEEDVVLGCTDPDATNYNSDATENDGSCDYDEEIEETQETEETEEPTPQQPQETTSQQPQEDFSNLFSLSSSGINDITINPNSSQEVSWTVTNDGEGFLFSCSFSSSGENSEWVSFDGEQRNINPEEAVVFTFNVEVPEEAEERIYALGVSVDCSSESASENFNLNVETKKIDFELLDAQRTRQDRVRIIYEISELIGEDQDVEISFSLRDSEGIELAGISENVSINANDTDEFRTDMDINESLNGTMLLVISYGSDIYSSSVSESVTLGAPIGGFAILEGLGAGQAYILIAVVLALGILFFIVRRMRKSKKTLKSLVDTESKKK